MKNDMKAAVSPMEMDVRIFPYRGDGPVAAIASVTLNGCGMYGSWKGKMGFSFPCPAER